MRDGTTGKQNEGGLSEVIGFVLIIGLIVVVATLYLTYGVPAQGRENEILHMNMIKDQFVSYKLSLDSLFNNNKVGTTVSNSFNLGTSGGYSQGAFGFIPVISPINSGGVIAINQRTTVPETLSIQSQSLVLNNSVHYTQDLPSYANFTPTHVYINISGIQQTDLNTNGYFGITTNTTDWIAIVNLTPHSVHFNETKSVNCPSGGGACTITYSEGDRYTGTDVSLSVIKGSLLTMQNTIVYQNISPNTVYSIDLMDEAYGLKSATAPNQFIQLNPGISLGAVKATGNITYNFAEMSPYTASPIPLGSIEYRAQNNYWIPQNYYYQMGGVFLQQSEGSTTYKLPPEITFTYDNQTDPAKKIVTVNVNALTIDEYNRGVVGGNSPVQIKTTLMNVTPFPYAAGYANTRWIRIGVNTSDSQARAMWSNYFNYTAFVAGVPNFVVGQAGTESYIRINGYDTSETGRYDINVIASNATYSTSVHGIGGIVE
jgi:hypothetical protein